MTIYSIFSRLKPFCAKHKKALKGLEMDGKIGMCVYEESYIFSVRPCVRFETRNMRVSSSTVLHMI